METTPLRAKILETVVGKSNLKQKVFDNTFAAFNLLKDTLFELAAEMDDELDGKLDRRTRLEYRDRGKFEAQLQIASDLLIFQMPPKIARLYTKISWFTIATPDICSVPSCPTIILSKKLTRLVMAFCRIMGIASSRYLR